jgi:hypothetical protein
MPYILGTERTKSTHQLAREAVPLETVAPGAGQRQSGAAGAASQRFPSRRILKPVILLSLFAIRVARPERLELPTLWFEARCSIQLSYGRAENQYNIQAFTAH